MFKNSQSAIEYLTIIGISFALIIPTIYLFYNYSQESNSKIVDLQLSSIGRNIINTAQSIYYSGEHSKTILKLNMPDNVNNITLVANRELVFNVRTDFGNTEIIFFSNINLTTGGSNCAGIVCILSNLSSKGLQNLKIESINGGNSILLEQAEDVFPPVPPVCGDNVCNGVETCLTCPGDCGACPDTEDPIISIESPTSNPTFSTGFNPLDLSGTASDNVGVTQVTWACLSGCSGSGTASGTTSWSITGINLVSGNNDIEVTAHDAALNTGTDTILVTFTPPGSNWYNPSWQFRKNITIDNTKVDADLTDFPVLISFIDTDLRDEAKNDGDDILFTSSDGSTKLSHEIEKFDGATGELAGWVKVPILSSTVDTIIYMYYGNSGAANQEDVVNVWDANYKSVWHLHSDEDDSTLNNNGSNQGSINAAGKIADSQSFDGLDDYIDLGDVLNMGLSDWSVGSWIKTTDLGAIFIGNAWSNPNYFVNMGNRFIGNLRGNPGPYITANSSTFINDDVWHYVIATYNRTSNLSVYVDGVFEQAADISSESSVNNVNTNNFAIGGNCNAGCASVENFFDGSIDEVRVSDIARSATWISTEYNNQNSPSTFYTVGGESSPETEDPTITITSPTPNPTFATGSTPLDIGGTASDNVGVTSVTWACLSGCSGSGTATGTTNWNISGINLVSGLNDIEVMAQDAAGNNGTDSILVTFTPPGSNWYNISWQFRKNITIDNTQVDGDLTDFPVLISLTDTDLRDEAQNDGDDILFTSSDGTTKLSHEIELFVGGTGELVAWVKVPFLSSNFDTDLFMYYGNAAAPNQEDVVNVWDVNYKGVWHLAEDPSISSDGDCGGGSDEICDSTSNNNDGDMFGSMTSGDLITAKIRDGLDLDGSDDYFNLPLGNGLDIIGNQLTLSGWARTPVGGVDNDEALINKDGPGYPYMIGMQDSSNPTLDQTNCRVDTDSGSSQINSLAVPRGVWVYLVCRYDGSSNEAFVDAVSVGSQSVTGNIVAANNIWFGRRSGSRRYEGDMDELRVSNIVRSDAWISTEYNNQNSPSTFYSVGSEESSSPDTENPTITITSPTTNPTYSTSTTPLSLGGTSSDNVAVTSVTWTCLSGCSGSGTASGTTSWSVTGISLVSGLNNIEVTAHDAAGNNGTDSILVTYTPPPSNWWDPTFPKCMDITISNLGSSALSNFPAYISVNYDNDMQSDFDDLRFIDTDCDNNGNQLDHEIEDFIILNNADVWVRIPSLPSSGDTISVYYGNSSVGSGENIQGVWDSNYEGVWHLNDDFLDSTSNINHVTNSGSTDVNGIVADSQNFQGNDKLTDTSTNSLNINSRITLEAWVFPTDLSGSDNNVVNKGISGSRGYGMSFKGNRLNFIKISVGDVTSNVIGNINQWQHFATTWNSNIDNVIFYKNGDRSQTISDSSGVIAPANSDDLVIGSWVTGSGAWFLGRIDEIRISSIDRSDAWIKQTYEIVANQASLVTFGLEETQ